MAPKAAAKAAAPAAKKAPPKAPAKVASTKAPAKKTAAKKAVAKKAGAKGGKVAAAAPQQKQLFEKRPRHFGIGQEIPPKRDVTRFVRWPKYIVLQRQKRVLERRLKVPPTLNQFRKTLNVHTQNELFKFAQKYRPEDSKTRRQRLRDEATQKAAKPAEKTKGKKVAKPEAPKRFDIKFGIQRVTRLVESGRAKLVLIAHDVDPIEIVVWLPALCKKLDIPYAIVKSKAALGRLTGFKTASCAAFMNIKPDDQSAFNKLTEAVTLSFNDKYDENRRQWGGMQMGRRSRAAKRRAVPQ